MSFSSENLGTHHELASQREMLDAKNKTIKRLIAALDQIQQMAADDLREGIEGASTAQIEADARAAIKRDVTT